MFFYIIVCLIYLAVLGDDNALGILGLIILILLVLVWIYG